MLTIEMSGQPPTVNAIFKMQVAGSITPTKLPNLINCMNANHDYIAFVTSIKGAACELLVQHA